MAEEKNGDVGREPDEVLKIEKSLKEPGNVMSFALTGIFVLACLYTLYFARVFFIPLVFATIFNVLLSPLVKSMKKVKIPEAAGAGIIMITLVLILGGSFYFLSTPATKWLKTVPSNLAKLEQKFKDLRSPVEDITETAEKIEKITAIDKKDDKPSLEVKKPGYANILFYQTWDFVLGTSIMFILLYFLLASGDLFRMKLVNVLPTLENKKRAVEIVKAIESDVSKYLVTIFIINTCMGVLIGAAMYIYKMPNPILWGVMAGLLNFILFLGPAVGIIVVAIVAAITFDTTSQMLLPPLTYFVINTLEGNFITPIILGRRLTLNPVVIFISLLFWGWIWGIAGALIAVPVIVITKLVCDKVDALKPVGEFLGK